MDLVRIIAAELTRQNKDSMDLSRDDDFSQFMVFEPFDLNKLAAAVMRAVTKYEKEHGTEA